MRGSGSLCRLLAPHSLNLNGEETRSAPPWRGRDRRGEGGGGSVSLWRREDWRSHLCVIKAVFKGEVPGGGGEVSPDGAPSSSREARWVQTPLF